MPTKLFLVKLVHTVVFLFMSACLLYILYCGLTRTYHWTVLAAIGAILLDGLVLLLNQWECPLTALARRYGDTRGSVTDFFFPHRLARHVFDIAVVLFPAELLLLSAGYLMK